MLSKSISWLHLDFFLYVTGITFKVKCSQDLLRQLNHHLRFSVQLRKDEEFLKQCPYVKKLIFLPCPVGSVGASFCIPESLWVQLLVRAHT